MDAGRGLIGARGVGLVPPPRLGGSLGDRRRRRPRGGLLLGGGLLRGFFRRLLLRAWRALARPRVGHVPGLVVCACACPPALLLGDSRRRRGGCGAPAVPSPGISGRPLPVPPPPLAPRPGPYLAIGALRTGSGQLARELLDGILQRVRAGDALRPSTSPSSARSPSSPLQPPQ